jgi:hypothetical protein
LSADVANAGTFTTDYLIRVDQTLPEQLTLKEVVRQHDTDPNVSFIITATDTLSGVDHYLIGVDGEEAVRWVPDESQEFHYRASPGVHALHATVVDKAGNTLSQDQSFEVTHLPSPRLTLHEVPPSEGDPLQLIIKASENALLTVFIAQNGGAPQSEKITADGSGNANFVSQEKLARGTAQVWASATDQSGGVSKESERLSIDVSATLWGAMTRHTFISVAALLLVFLMIFSAFFFSAQRRRKPHHQSATHETKQAHQPQPQPQPAAVRGQIVLKPRARVTEHRTPPTRLR